MCPTLAMPLLLPVSVSLLVAVLMMDITGCMSSLDGVLTATVTTSELVRGIISVALITVDRNKLKF